MKKQQVSEVMSHLASLRHAKNPLSSEKAREMAKKRWEKTRDTYPQANENTNKPSE